MLYERARAVAATPRCWFRLSTIRDADTILVMENEKIAELYMSQFAGGNAEEVPVDDSTAVHC